ncbi:MAG: hypothetical protein ABUK01_05910 [Leptospirales bacterium]
MPIVFSHLSEGLYSCEPYPALFLYNSGTESIEKTLTDFIHDDSCLIFCDTPPADLDDFTLRVKVLRRDPALKMVWVQYPDLLDDPGKLRGLKIQNGKLIDRGLFRFRNHILYLYPGSTLETNGDLLTFQAPNGKTSAGYFMTGFGVKSTGAIQGEVDIEVARSRPGRLKFNIDIHEADLNLLDAGIRYFFPDQEEGQENGSDYIDSLRFPVFSPGEQSLKCTAFLHPLHSLRRDNEQPETIFKFSSSATIPSYFRTPLGQTIWVTPTEGAGLIYERKMETMGGRNSDAWYLTPWGSFSLSTHESPEIQTEQFPSLMPGTSGTEFYQGGFDSHPFYMTFRNGCNAYLPNFKKNRKPNDTQQTTNAQEDSLVLEDRACTSYVRFHGGLATYFAQPSEQPFYVPGGPDDSASFLATPIANLADRSVGTIAHRKECVPVLPFGGIDANCSEAALRLELCMAAPVRSQKMKYFQRADDGSVLDAYSPIPVNTAGGVPSRSGTGVNYGAPAMDGITSVTPGGYIGNFSHDLSQWRRMLITTGSDDQPFAINNIKGPLKNALLSSRRISVMSDPILFLENDASLENPLLSIAGWGFDIDPALWFNFNTILVFKDHPESMEELVKRPDEWTEGQFLNLDPWDISDRLQESAEVARKAVDGGDLDFAPFLYQIWQNPNWNGFIAFNVSVSPVGFPDDLAIIAGGVDPTKLKAHHVGVSSSALERQESGSITGGRGALFGLVDYNDDSALSVEASWDWTVRKLRARFRNSRLQTFQARIDVSIRELFGDKATTILKVEGKKGSAEITPSAVEDPEGRPTDTIILNGHYEEHDGKGRYTFRSKEKLPFYTTSGVLEEVMLHRAGFETTSVGPGEDGTGLDVKGRFLLAGHLKFRAQEGFDIFSYDKIPMNNMALNLSFSVPAKAKETPVSEITFSIEPMRIQAATAEARTNALANRFPLALDSLRLLPENGISALKLAPVVSPIPQTTRPEAGYQLEYRLDLGLGSIKVYLTIAWWPNGKNSAVNMGLRIPGFDGSFSIVDDLIKIGPEQIQFMTNPETGETILLFRRLGIHMPLGLTLPMDGNIDAALFGDPNAGGSGKVAWYAAWNKPE